MKDVMVDLETMGTGYRAAIVVIGAVQFELGTPQLGKKFYRTIDLNSCQVYGQAIDAHTVLWWMQQEDAARTEVMQGTGDLAVVLKEFAEFLGTGSRVWGNGSNFDNRLLREAYELVGQPCPWHWRDDRDMRTICAIAKSLGMKAALPFTGTKHNALHDAVHQAMVVNVLYTGISRRVR